MVNSSSVRTASFFRRKAGGSKGRWSSGENAAIDTRKASSLNEEAALRTKAGGTPRAGNMDGSKKYR